MMLAEKKKHTDIVQLLGGEYDVRGALKKDYTA